MAELQWRSTNDLPPCDSQVLVKATNPSYQFGHPQLMAGFFIKEFYDVQVNKFRLTGIVGDWTVVAWAYAPDNA